MPYCVFKHCKSCSQKPRRKDEISFHKFPANATFRKEWVSIVRKSRKENDWMASKFCVICSLHFKEEDFYLTDKGRRLIKKQAKPTQRIYELPPSPQNSDVPTQKLIPPDDAAENVYENDNVALSSFTGDELLEPLYEKSPIDEIKKSEDVSVRGTSRKNRLRRELKRDQLFRVVTKQKLRTLQQKVRRLKKRNASLTNIIKKILKDRKCTNCDTHKQLCDIAIP